MSYDISLIENNRRVKVSKHTEGGTYVKDGIDEACLNVTYNYGKFYWEHLDKKLGIKGLNKVSAKDCIPKLEKAIKILGTDRSGDYWQDIPGNAGYALSILLGWAKQYPNATFEVI